MQDYIIYLSVNLANHIAPPMISEAIQFSADPLAVLLMASLWKGPTETEEDTADT